MPRSNVSTRKNFLASLLAAAAAGASAQADRPNPGATSKQKRPARKSQKLRDAKARIDVWTHVLPPPYAEKLNALAPAPVKPVLNMLATIQPMHDIEARFRVMDRFDNYRQVLTLVPFVHLAVSSAEPTRTAELTRLGNDALADLAAKYPRRFAGFVASLPLNDVDEATKELDRSVRRMGALGIQLEANVNGLPLDDARFEPVFGRMAELQKPIWIHPARPMSASDFPTEKMPKYPLIVALGWPYETALCLSRLVFAGYFDRYSSLKIIAHHGGGMIPHFAGRLGPYLEEWGPRLQPSFKDVLGELKKPLLDYFRMFYVDTALYQSAYALDCVIDFFGTDRILFGTDTPFDTAEGSFIEDAIASLNMIDIDSTARARIYSENALGILGIQS